jgi:hypothetical protein
VKDTRNRREEDRGGAWCVPAMILPGGSCRRTDAVPPLPLPPSPCPTGVTKAEATFHHISCALLTLCLQRYDTHPAGGDADTAGVFLHPAGSHSRRGRPTCRRGRSHCWRGSPTLQAHTAGVVPILSQKSSTQTGGARQPGRRRNRNRHNHAQAGCHCVQCARGVRYQCLALVMCSMLPDRGPETLVGSTRSVCHDS